MNWSEQTEKMIESWAETQRQLWSTWLGQGAAGDPPGAAAPDGPLDNLAWLRKAADLWGRQGVLGRTVGSLLGSQEMLARSVELLAGAWQQVLPRLDTGEDWQGALRDYLDQWINRVTAVPEQAAGASREAAQLMNSMLWDWSPVMGPWMNTVLSGGLSGDLGASLLKSSEGFDRLLAMEQDFEPAIAGLGEIPRAGLLRERNAKLLLAMDAMTHLRGAAARYQVLVAQGLAEAVEATIRHIIERADEGKPLKGVRELVRTWFRIADKTLMHTFSSPQFIAAQNEVAAASMDYKVRQRELLSMVYEALEIPTRGELDDLYRSLHELKREVRGLRRAQRAAVGAAKGAAYAPASDKQPPSAPRKRTARRKPAKPAE